MDLEQEDVLWVGKERSKDCFSKLFEEIDLMYLSNVKAIAMDMNASYNILFEKFLPHAKIVYDRYHMQSQYGNRAHGAKAKEIEKALMNEEDPILRKELKIQSKNEKCKYSSLKGSRWMLISNGNKLSDEKARSLNAILN